ncbi:BatD family protein [Sulfurospirillum sp. 1307]
MKLVGRIALFLIITLNLYAATAKLSSSSIVQGDRVILIISASGEDIKFPEIKKISGFEVSSTGLSQSITNINGKVTKKIEKHYEFMPTKSIDIPAFEVKVNGEIEKTNPLHVEVSKANIQNSKFLFEMRANKKNIMQFEPVKLEFVFKRDINEEVNDLRFLPPKFDNFWVKEGKKKKPYQEGRFVVHTMTYFLYPQKSGDFELNPARIDVGLRSNRRDIFGFLNQQLDWKSVFSNPISLHVKPLIGANLYGKFEISASVDKNSIKANEAVNYTLKIKGEGNFDDIDEFDLKIDGANIYKDKPKIKTYALSDAITGEFEQKFSITSSSDFTIPSVKLTYYDASLKKVVTKKTNPINIKVDGSKVEKTLQVAPQNIEKKEVIKEIKVIDYKYIALAFIGGFFIAFIIFYIFSKKKDIKLPKFKSDKDYLKELLKYRGEDEKINEQIKLLEENIYANKKNRIDKEVLKKFLKHGGV